ncbi:valine--tRNA ligase [Candidatus Micrarchaeota archaeon]|nr:valine--tRNA ligase [Candidatus Micrarchaeota archaeon]
MLPERFDKSMEKKWQEYWQENKIFKFDETKLKTGNSKHYSIDTPPPFTSGELHMGHVLSYSFFDFVARYKRMNGYNVYYPQGWDCQGFPTEVKVEQKFGRLKPAEFREKCVAWTGEFIARMKQQMIEMGFSPDWKFEYRTMDPEYHKKVQISLIEMYNKKLIYRAEYPVYWCPKCVSAIAKAELDDEEKDGIIYDIKFTGPNGEDLIIATTRPELIPACVAVMFNPEDERYKSLQGKKAKTALGKEVPIIPDKEVDKEFGTGILQVCTFGDKMDVVWMHRYKLPLIDCIDQFGKMKNTGIKEIDGLKATEAKKKIVEILEKDGKIVGKKNLKQVVKVHDRCKTLVELIPSKQWFADIRTTGKKIKDLAHEVKWFPDFGITYLIDWVEGAEWDWVISRQRVFGTPLPFYYCGKCNATIAADINELPYYAEKSTPKKCKCGAELKPETSTCDCWVDSSITPLIISGWPDDKEKFAKLYPNSLRPQGVEIVRTWAFYTIYRSGVGLTGKKPWENILLNGNVLAPDGKKMSKSLGNIISPSQLQQEYPTDAIRQWAAMSGAMAKDRPFSYEDIKYAKSFLNKLWNAARLVEKSTDDYTGKSVSFKDLSLVDRWILSRLHELIKSFTEHMEVFEFQQAINKLHTFFWHDVCDNYLEYVKYRIYGIDKKAKHNGQYVLRYILFNTIKLLAPFASHISEELYHALFEQEAKKTKSIHLSEWPEAKEIDEKSVETMGPFNQVIGEVRQYKSKNKMPQNAELTKIKLSLDTLLSYELVNELKAIGKIKEVEQEKGEFKVEVS